MRRLAVVLLLLSTGARDAPPESAQRIASLIHDACFYGAAHPRRERITASHFSPERRFASHFGRIVKTSPADDSGLRTYVLAVPQLPGWHMEFNDRHFLLDIPDSERLLLRDLEQFLGESKPSHDCQAMKINPFEAPPKPISSMDFTPKGWPMGCGISVSVVYDTVNGRSEERVIDVAFSAAW